jgi:hypothetical protein
LIVPGIYWEEIKGILTPGRRCMANVQISTDQGVFLGDLTDYQNVKRLGHVIAGALNAWERDATGQWIDPPAQTKRNAMPFGAPLAVAKVDKFLEWVADGMPETDAIA